MRTRLRDLDAKFVGAGGDGVFNADGTPAAARTGVGVSFKCPCGAAHDEYDRVFVAFANPIDGGPAVRSEREPTWNRTGETIDDLTLTPSIQRMDQGGCRWHGFVMRGEAHE